MRSYKIKKAATLLFAVLLACALTVAFVPASARADEQELLYIMDSAGVLTEEEYVDLYYLAQDVSEKHDCGVYIVTIEDAGMSMAELNDYLAENYSMGSGSDSDFIILSMDMGTRDYDLLANGELGKTAFTDGGRELLAELFLEDFSEDDWYGGMQTYINGCEYFLEQAEAGTPVDAQSSSQKSGFAGLSMASILIRFLLIPFGIAILVCLILKSKMKSVAKAAAAKQYAVGGMVFTRRADRFTHRTETREKVASSGSSGGGGGNGHTGGKF